MVKIVVWVLIDGSVVVFALTYLDDAWVFALGLLYTLTNLLATAAEVAAVAAMFGSWPDAVNNGSSLLPPSP